MTARLGKDGWFRCAKCGHKLGRTAGAWDDSRRFFPAIEIKCHSCKSINYLNVGMRSEEMDMPQDVSQVDRLRNMCFNT